MSCICSNCGILASVNQP